MKKFWKWKNRTVTNQENQTETVERTLFLNGTIAEESWFDDDVTPQLFKEELMGGTETSRSGSTAPAATAWRRPRSTTC